MIGRDVFMRHVRDALANLYDPVHLQTHPLAEALGLRSRPGKTVGAELRERLWQAIEALDPDASPRLHEKSAEALSYRLLWLHYVQALSQEEACRELGLSQRSFYRRRREAVEAVAGVLWDRGVVCAAHGDSAATGAPRQARDEAMRLASRASWQYVDLATLLGQARGTLSSLSVEQGVRLDLDLPSELPGALGDPAMFHQLLLNLLIEGLRLAQGQALTLAGRQRARDTLWTLRWIDATRAPGGDPLRAPGVSLSQGLLEVYGGRMWVEAQEPDRAAICFTVPVAKPYTVALVDDDSDTLELHRRYLQAGGYVVRSARGWRGLEQLLGQAAPDVVVLDVLMPREDGWRIMQRLKTVPETAPIPVIVCSVLSQPQLALSLGACEVLQKPISEDILLTAVRRALPAAGSAAAGARGAPVGT